MLRRVLATVPAQASRAVQTAARPTTAHFARTITPAVQNASSRRGYHEKVLDHYNNPRNVGSMQKNAEDVGTGLVGAPACGDVMKLQIKVDPANDTITDVKFKTFGCGSAIASSSYLTELVRGMSLEQAGKIRNTEIAKELCLPPVKCKLYSKARLSRWLDANDDYSALLDACGGRHQVRYQQLLHQEPEGQANRPRRHWRRDAKD